MTRDVSDVTHRKCGLRFEKSWLIEFCRRKKKVDFRLPAKALWRVHVVWGRWKSQHRKMVSLSLCRKTFKLKGNKKCFSCFGIPMLYICALWTLRSGMNMSISRIHIWLCNTFLKGHLSESEFELAYFKEAVQCFNHYATGAPPQLFMFFEGDQTVWNREILFLGKYLEVCLKKIYVYQNLCNE